MADPRPPFFRGSHWYDDASFHDGEKPLYTGDPETSHLYKQGEHMARVRYEPSHPNPTYDDSRAGRGVNHCIWVAGERGPQAEGVSRGGLAGIIDSWLEPGASIGWHQHDDTEEVYYLIDGDLEVWTADESGREYRWQLHAGDSSRVGPGMSHSARAGDAGVRFLVVMVEVQDGRPG